MQTWFQYGQKLKVLVCPVILNMTDIIANTYLVFFSFIIEYLKVRSHDPEEAIRHDVIVTIITAAKRDLALVNDQLLGFVRERTLDKRVNSEES